MMAPICVAKDNDTPQAIALRLDIDVVRLVSLNLKAHKGLRPWSHLEEGMVLRLTDARPRTLGLYVRQTKRRAVASCVVRRASCTVCCALCMVLSRVVHGVAVRRISDVWFVRRATNDTSCDLRRVRCLM